MSSGEFLLFVKRLLSDRFATVDQQMFVNLFQKKKSNWFDSLVKLGCQ